MESIDESMAVNLKSAVRLSQCALGHLQRSEGQGEIFLQNLAFGGKNLFFFQSVKMQLKSKYFGEILIPWSLLQLP